MSLVLEALQRVEKSDLRAGSVGVAVPSSRPTRNRRGTFIPLLLGLGTGAVLFPFGPRPPDPASRNAKQAPFTRARAAVPPMRLLEPVVQPRDVAPPPDSSAPGVETGRRGSGLGLNVEGQPPPPLAARKTAALEIGTPSLVLQAISERDSRPIAIINDQLVREGDLLGRVRVLFIGPDFVDLLLENGKKETVRFSPPPPDPSPSPERP